jgi:PAS domain S-box-containing protein
MRDSDKSRKELIDELKKLKKQNSQNKKKLKEFQNLRERLLSSEEQWRSITENSPDHIVTLDKDLRIQFVNYSSPGLDKEDLIGKPIYKYVDEDQQERVKVILEKAFKEGKTVSYETSYQPPVGNTIYYESLVFPRLLNNKVIGLTLSARDITRRKNAEKEVIKQNKFLNRVIESLSFPFYVINSKDFSVELANSAAKKTTVKENITCYALLHEKDTPCSGTDHLCPVKIIKRTKKPFRTEHIHIDENGTKRTYEIRGFPVMNEEGSVEKIIECAVDLTEQKAIEEEQRKLEAHLHQIQKYESLDLLAGSIAHNFNNILMGILGNLEIAINELPSKSSLTKNLKKAEKGTEHLAELTRLMLSYVGQGKGEIQSLDLAEVIKELNSMFKSSIPRKIKLEHKFSEESLIFNGDPFQVRQVIMNIVSNSVEALGKKRGIITISTGKMYCDNIFFRAPFDEDLPAGKYVFVEITDNGMGMDTETLKRVFDPFFTTRVKGRGMGMSAVLGIVRSHKGSVLLNSKPGIGTAVKVLFPEVEPYFRPKKKAAETIVTWKGTGTILVVDDEKVVREVAKEMLNQIGFEVLLAANGFDALRIFKKHSKDITCVLLDMTMPKMDGEEAFQRMRQINPSIPVVIFSGHTVEDVKKRFQETIPSAFIPKPFKQIDLQRKMYEILGS